MAHQTCHAALSTSWSEPAFSITNRLRLRLSADGSCERIICRASASVNPRVLIRRSQRSCSGASTRTTTSKAFGSRTSNNSGMSLTTMQSPLSLAWASSSPRRRCTTGWTMAFSAVRASPLPATARRRATRSNVPSGRIISPPKRAPMAARTEDPGACTSRTKASASMTVAPQSANNESTVDFPAAILPVRPTLNIGDIAAVPDRGAL